jgi:hypothetical protein
MAVIDDFEQVAALLRGQRHASPRWEFHFRHYLYLNIYIIYLSYDGLCSTACCDIHPHYGWYASFTWQL